MKTIHRFIIGIMAGAIITLSVILGRYYADERRREELSKYSYDSSTYGLIVAAQDIQMQLAKTMVATTAEERIVLLNDVCVKAESASNSLTSAKELKGKSQIIRKYLAQTSDFSRTLIYSSTQGKPMNEENIKNAVILRDGAEQLKLLAMGLENNFTDYKGISYDGESADNIINSKPCILLDQSVSEELAQNIAIRSLSWMKINKIEKLETKSNVNVDIPVYSYSFTNSNDGTTNIRMDVTVNGGKLLYYYNPRKLHTVKIEMDNAIIRGLDFINRNGFKDMIPINAAQYENAAVITYAYTSDHMVMYPDTVKVKVALDNGEIIGLQSSEYLDNHTDRSSLYAVLKSEEAYRNVNPGLDVSNIRLCVIKKNGVRDVLCYEFYGTYNDEKYLVYINATNAMEEEILKVVPTENGEVTM